jgi:dimethylhistidine N-methyltransferase
MLAPGGLLVLASPMDWTKEFTPGDCIVRDLRKFFDSSWECVGSTDIQYDWRVTSRYAQRFKSQVLCMKKDGGQSGNAQCKAAIDEAVFVEEVFLRKFAIDVGKGLSHPVKTLPSLYFYDDIGSQIYSKITECQDYYLTRVEHSLLTIPANLRAISDLIVSKDSGHGFNLVELGAGDGSKTTLLLNHFLQLGLDFTYRPIDISAGALETLAEKMRAKFNLNGDQPLLPALSMRSLHADNVQGLTALVEDDQKELHAKGLEGSRTNVVLFLGSSIGNMNGNEGAQFLRAINGSLQEDDIMIIGFDLRKDPNLMIAAYSDREGITAEFNYNLLRRINRELGANFQIDQFKHHCTYCPRTSEMQSWLVSQQQQTVTIASLGRSFDFGAWECMQTESSFKYSINQIEEMAARAGFVVNEHLADAAGWMRLSTWTVKKGASVH